VRPGSDSREAEERLEDIDEAVDTDLSSCGIASNAKVGLKVSGGDVSRSYVVLDIVAISDKGVELCSGSCSGSCAVAMVVVDSLTGDFSPS
jgi:hypothetical protein